MRPINLVPKEARKDRRGVGGALLVAVGLVIYLGLLGYAFVWWDGRVDTARDDLARQQTLNQLLEREVAALAPVGQVRDEYEERAEYVRLALENDVDWGMLLNDLGRLIPPRVWVDTFSGAVEVNDTQAVLGRVAFSGVGFDYPDVAEWLRSLDGAQFRGVTGTWVSLISRREPGVTDIVTFTSSASLSRGAATGRAESLIPEVP